MNLSDVLVALNDFNDKTLEETVIQQMVPLVRSAGPPGMAAPKPKLESDNNASPV